VAAKLAQGLHTRVSITGGVFQTATAAVSDIAATLVKVVGKAADSGILAANQPPCHVIQIRVQLLSPAAVEADPCAMSVIILHVAGDLLEEVTQQALQVIVLVRKKFELLKQSRACRLKLGA